MVFLNGECVGIRTPQTVQRSLKYPDIPEFFFSLASCLFSKESTESCLLEVKIHLGAGGKIRVSPFPGFYREPEP